LNIKNSRYSYNLFEEENSAKDLLSLWEEDNFLERLWHKDWSLWVDTFQPEIVDRLGWLELPVKMKERIKEIETFTEEVKKEQFSDLILIGMGGSSLAPEVFQKTFREAPGFPKLTVCDSTHPERVKEIRKRIHLKSTLFIVSSKSGTTLETLSLFHFFWSEFKKMEKDPGSHFIAVTDYGTPLMREAQDKKFRKIFNPYPDIGGRFSALTEFGLVPASLTGVDVKNLLDYGEKDFDLFLGAVLGSVGERRDKLTFVTSETLRAFPSWLEQLVAESLGKDGKGMIPVINDPWIKKEADYKDRFFVFFYLDEEYREIGKYVKIVEDKKVPFIKIELRNKYELGSEIFNWETAVAAVGSYLKVHAFNQPDVQAAKDFAGSAIQEFSKKRKGFKEIGETFPIEDQGSLKKAMEEWLSQKKRGDYAAVQAYLAPSEKVSQRIQKIRLELQKRLGITTTMGFGPRFLHSTGQLHKGGPDKGLFLQIIDTPQVDIQVPGEAYSFKSIIRAQSLGDFQALKEKNRRILRVDLGTRTLKGLNKLIHIIGQ
jgi:transaldolase / glucose-6-phosphate isomerase